MKDEKQRSAWKKYLKKHVTFFNNFCLYRWRTKNKELNSPEIKEKIQVKSVSEAGYPSNPIESDWSDSIIIGFPTDSSSFNEIESILEQNKKDIIIIIEII